MDLAILAGLRNRIEWHDSIGSTNDRARELAREGAGHGFVVGTDAQTAGRGRKGAEWFCGAGEGLAFSVVVRPEWPVVQWGWLSIAAGLAVCEALETLGLAPEVKWPNDVLLEGKKACGILIETEGRAAIVGIGINVNEGTFPAELEAVSLAQLHGSPLRREEVLGVVWNRLLEVLTRSPAEVAEGAWARLAWLEREVEIAEGERGRIRGFGPHGELTVEVGGRLERILSADGLRLADR